MDNKKIELKIEELEGRIAPTGLAPDCILIVKGVGADVGGCTSPDGVAPPEVIVNGELVTPIP